ncbi:hypothetical protein [Chromobacterium amazonense]|uniref:hypothetical protein n=1 Tax=Chromobacterium amazonense TaxID=1382803 RepID=UPI0011B1EAE4|nr:hypothetical protein [Chromobacterium amazonense]
MRLSISQPQIYTSSRVNPNPTDQKNETKSENFHYTPPYTKEECEEAYSRVFNQIKDRYAAFDQKSEIGFGEQQGLKGLTGNIHDVSKEDICKIMMHIHDNEVLLEQCCNNSAKSPFFDKFYLMKDPDQNWNLRLHHFNARGSGLGGDDSPHYHRWTLASKPLQGGYINVNYEEKEISPETDEQHKYSKYLLGATDAQSSKVGRQIQPLGQSEMKPVKYTLFEEGSTNHFPITDPHSVLTQPKHFGSTVTLAHTGKPVHESSFAFEKGDLKDIPQMRFDSISEFKSHLEKEIAFLQATQLKDDLLEHLNGKNPSTLTKHEIDHLCDSKEPNYLETSFFSALAIYNMAKAENEPSHEFSPDTSKFLDERLQHINVEALNEVIKFNQEDLFNPDTRFVTDFSVADEISRLRASMLRPANKTS